MDHRCIHFFHCPGVQKKQITGYLLLLQSLKTCHHNGEGNLFDLRTSDWSTSPTPDFRDFAILQLRIYSNPDGIWEHPNLSSFPFFTMCTFMSAPFCSSWIPSHIHQECPRDPGGPSCQDWMWQPPKQSYSSWLLSFPLIPPLPFHMLLVLLWGQTRPRPWEVHPLLIFPSFNWN